MGLYILGKAAFSNLINSGKRTLYDYILLYFIYIYKKVPLWANRHMGVLNNAGDYAREYMVCHCGYAPMTNFSPRDFSIVFSRVLFKSRNDLVDEGQEKLLSASRKSLRALVDDGAKESVKT